MTDRRTSGWRAWAAAGIFVGLVVAGVLITRPAPKPAPAPTATATAEPILPAMPTPLPPLSRADLIEAARRAASSVAAGEARAASDLPGRRFALSIPFGCDGPTEALKQAATGWSYDAGKGTLRVKATPQVWTDAPGLKAIAAGVDYEAAEGFWVERPWQLSETCPARSPAPGPSPAPGEAPASSPAPLPSPSATPLPVVQTLGLVELFEPGTKREERRNGRAYQAVQKLAPGEIALDRGLRLVVEGRLVAFDKDQAIGCWSASPDQRPVCLIRVRFDRIAITGPTGEHVVAEWKS
ncbi:hypothetical protein GON01_01230 [Sphingomonas sp. MAH-20]|uniref:Uncharacterized protein n=1 Tax=Sphingomonas horti TaxID=2682842 RepID=A0A6I4IX01_9SPHN|nr:MULTISPECIES: hypothetical protein [Sphingomonas]MBA2920309.1 hypothetical protein [Sphingomonas sp. CGMCC 1.13658]MVO76563.1 hypothetical protein [Sphingomonas horti]